MPGNMLIIYLFNECRSLTKSIFENNAKLKLRNRIKIHMAGGRVLKANKQKF